MELKDYIRQSYKRPNRKVLETLGASEALINYLKTTPWNTNINIVNSFVDDSSNINEDDEDNDVTPEVKIIFVNHDGSLGDGSKLNSAKDIYDYLEEYGPDYLNVLDNEFYQFEFDHKGDDTYYYIYNDGHYEFQITITSSNIEWFSND